MQLVVLWSDFFFWLLFMVGVGLFFYHFDRRPLFRASLSRLLSNRTAVICLCILSIYFLIALVDSVHVRRLLPTQDHQVEAIYETEPVSLLDLALDDLRLQKETTYSAPFSLYSANKETIETPDGTARIFPRLLYGGAHLADAQDRPWDIAQTVLKSLGVGLMGALIGLSITIGLLVIRHRCSPKRVLREQFQERHSAGWKSAYATFGLIVVLGCVLRGLSYRYHVFGTDAVGQDVFYLSLKAIRCSLLIGTLPTLVLLPIAIWLGLIAGYFRGWIDDVVQYVYTTLNSIPGILLIAAAILAMQVGIEMHADWFQTSAQRADLRLLALCVVLGATGWTGLCRLIRAETLKLRELEFVQAAQAFGVSHLTILRRHLLPNVFHLILISIVIDFSGLVLAEAVLSYVGIGVDPSMISFGTMINTARMEMARDPVVWWSLLAAFGFLFALVLSANLLADSIQEAFDPRSRMIDRRACWLKLRAARDRWLRPTA